MEKVEELSYFKVKNYWRQTIGNATARDCWLQAAITVARINIQFYHLAPCLSQPPRSILLPLSVSPYMLCPRPFLRYSFRASRAIIGNTSRATARPTYRATSDLATARAAETQTMVILTRHRLGCFCTHHSLGGGRIRPPPCYLENGWR